MPASRVYGPLAASMRLALLISVALLTMLCYPWLQDRQVGSAAAETDWADCSSCHADYASQLPQLKQLRRSGLGSNLGSDCLECHDLATITQPRLDWSHPVRSVGEHIACTMCHVPVAHGPGQPPPMPVGDYGSGCFDCHASQEMELHLFSRHPSDLRVGCIDCHPAHEPFRAGLPLDLLPQRIKGGFTALHDYERSNQLCLSCHPSGNLLSSLTEGFVTYNTTNYHELHVVRGRSLCIECHEAHGSMRKDLLRAELLGGQAMNYFPTGRGANCTTTCHGVDHLGFQYINRPY